MPRLDSSLSEGARWNEEKERSFCDRPCRDPVQRVPLSGATRQRRRALSTRAYGRLLRPCPSLSTWREVRRARLARASEAAVSASQQRQSNCSCVQGERARAHRGAVPARAWQKTWRSAGYKGRPTREEHFRLHHHMPLPHHRPRTLHAAHPSQLAEPATSGSGCLSGSGHVFYSSRRTAALCTERRRLLSPSRTGTACFFERGVRALPGYGCCGHAQSS